MPDRSRIYLPWPVARCATRKPGDEGTIDDEVARLNGGGHEPPVIGVQARLGGRDVFVPISRMGWIAGISKLNR